MISNNKKSAVFIAKTALLSAAYNIINILISNIFFYSLYILVIIISMGSSLTEISLKLT